MSLHALANHLQQAGRGEDKVLIHMTPKEVRGLQSLAMAHGGSLTVNPETGLPEAGFLSRLLPTLIGAGLTIASGGALSPLMAAGITGAGYGIAKGSLKEGLMAGLGAYGGAGLASGLNAAGAAAAPSANIGANANAVVDTGTAAAKAATNSSYTGAGANVGTSGSLQASNLSQPIIQNYPTAVMPKASDVMSRGFATTQVPQATEVALKAPTVVQTTVPNVTPSYFDNVKSGFGEATGSFEGLKNVWDKTPTGTGYGLAATGMGIMQDSQNKGIGAPKPSDSYLRPYDYSVSQNEEAYAPNASTSERMYFDQPRFMARPIQKLAVGGQPEREAAYQSVSMNDTYPMAQLNTPMYSDPSMQRPMAREVVNPSGDVGVDAFTGEARMASGGVAKAESTERKYTYNPETMKFTAVNPPAAPAQTGLGTLFRGFNGGVSGGTPFSLVGQLIAKQQAAAAPVTPETTGGIATPYIPQGQPEGAQNTSMVPNIQLQELRTPEQQLGLESFYDSMNQRLAQQGGYAGYAAGGGISTLGSYSDGGRLLKGPGDGVSDSIPASLGSGQPARLADGEFVVPARIVSEIGNGSTEAGARKLYQMMDRVQKARRKTVGKNQVAKNTKSERLLPA